MTQVEILSWLEFFKLMPFDDYHRFYRPAALVAHSMSGAELDDLLRWLEKRPPREFNSAEQNMMKNLGMKPPRKDSP